MEAFTIDFDPEVNLVEAPLLSVSQQGVVASSQKSVTLSPECFDGSILMVDTIAFSEKRIDCFSARYRWRFAASEEADLFRPLTLGFLKALVILTNSDGQVLCQRRAVTVEAGMNWSLSASGFLNESGSIGSQAQSILERELGLTSGDYSPLVPDRIGLSDQIVVVVYRAQISNRAVLRPEPSQVDDLLWANQDELPDPLISGSSDLLRLADLQS